MLNLEETDWMQDAICRGHGDLFFAPAGERAGARERREQQAFAMCNQCPVKVPCGEAGRSGSMNEDHEPEYGIWGSLQTRI